MDQVTTEDLAVTSEPEHLNALQQLEIREGVPHPRGASWDGQGVNFALFSAQATKVELCLFDQAGKEELHRIELPEFTDEIWHGYVTGLRPGTVYGFRVHGPVEYIKSLGVTAIELLPVCTYVVERHLQEKGLTNYWGYHSIGFFAPDPRYASDPGNTLHEFKQMIARYHDAGIEVILDVVYDHTAEGN